jgi:hypothetical protein
MTKSKQEDDPKFPFEISWISGPVPDFLNDPWEKVEKFIRSLLISEEKIEEFLGEVLKAREDNPKQ